MHSYVHPRIRGAYIPTQVRTRHVYPMQSEMYLMAHRNGDRQEPFADHDGCDWTRGGPRAVGNLYEAPSPSPSRPSFLLSAALPSSYCRRFDAWIPVCHSTCNTAYWLVLDDPSRGKTPAHRSSALNAPDAVANFDEVCGRIATRCASAGEEGRETYPGRESAVGSEGAQHVSRVIESGTHP